jgi:16S rRNA (uracil1498-N3)-methyltransferase
LSRVLRVVAGQTIVLFNGDGHDYTAEVVSQGNKEISLAVISRLPAVRESGLKITVVQTLSRGERMDQTLQKCTELGVAAFQPLFSERVEVRLRAEKLTRRLEHWQDVVVSACEQSGRAVIPGVLAALDFADWLDNSDAGRRLILVPGAETPLSSVELHGQVQIVVGPEGGFSAIELELARAHGVEAVSLGPRILRTETAAPAAVAVLQALAGDLA